ncbi:SulP family inorganic anion transporter [Metabacillus litoralis]|uniref:SulP family inorganic anion transporter n=1 Tax=Metabacillus litoralis TaxID=152268 RepID=UPI00203B372D|nr:SulP family inorganic anion transporter [Metabacillus litoralis]MCM3408484.1 SulP family inorganic anion transporter [Metabacillus litoralis]
MSFLHYKKEYIRGDLSSGLVVAALVIPQGIAYALIAGLPPVIGLYTATIPVLIYLLFGSSPHVSIGPVAMVSILIFSGVTPYAVAGTPEYIQYVAILTILVGVIQYLLHLLKVGVIVEHVPHGVISGFTSGCAVIIAMNQISTIIKMPLHDRGNMITSLGLIISNLKDIHVLTAIIGLTSVIALMSLEKLLPNYPQPIILILISTMIAYVLNVSTKGVVLIGEIPMGLPPFVLPELNLDKVTVMLPTAIVIAFIGFIETFAIAKVIAKKEGYSIRPNTELKSLGIANLIGGFFSSMPVAGGFSRSAVNYSSGAKTKFSSFFSAAIVIVTLACFTSLFAFIPKAVLASIILVSVIKLIDVKEAIHLLRTNILNGAILLLTFSVTIVSGPKFGLGIGIFLSILSGIRKVNISYSIR